MASNAPGSTPGSNELFSPNAPGPDPPRSYTMADRVKSRSRLSSKCADASDTASFDLRKRKYLETKMALDASMLLNQNYVHPPPQRRKLVKEDEEVEPEQGEGMELEEDEEEVELEEDEEFELDEDEDEESEKVLDESTAPINDPEGNRAFANEVIKALKSRIKSRGKMFGDRQNERILGLLEEASPAKDNEGLFLSGLEASRMLSTGSFQEYPIFTEGQQPLPLQSIQQFLGEYYDDETKVFIQDPSVKLSEGHNLTREVAIGQVKKRLLEGKSKGRPWNCLELATHVEDGLRPKFLSGEDSRLLTKLKLEQAGDYAGRRSYPQGYKEVEKWALLAEAGALTEPHQDSHGFSTYITVNEGNVGFGWLCMPSDEERKTWVKEPSDIPSDRYRYVVLKPGQTVYLPAGTVHFVFRLPNGGHTLAFGGHVLRCSTIVQWVKAILEEKANPSITNEDFTSIAPGYLDRVEVFVKQAQKNGTEDKWGGAEAIREFLRLKAEFMAE